jgi:hypothetical protein
MCNYISFKCYFKMNTFIQHTFETIWQTVKDADTSIDALFGQPQMYKACPSESGTEVGAPLFPAVELCDVSGRWQCMSGEIWYTLDSGSVLLTETEAR